MATEAVESISTSTGEDSQPAEVAKTGENNPNNQQGSNSNKKDRKPRRQGLPLPDPLPEKFVERRPEPDKKELQKKIADEEAKLQECFERLNRTRSFFEERQKIRDSSKPAFDSARKEFQQLNDECRAMFEERKSLSSRIKEIKESATKGTPSSGPLEVSGAGKDGNEALKNVRTMEELEARIDQMKYRLETESVPIAEEKRIVSQISFLNHKGREFIRGRDQSIKNEQAEKEAKALTRKDLEEKRAALDERIDASKAKLDSKKKEVDDIRAKQDADIQKLQDSTPTFDRDEEKKKISEIRANIRKIRDDFQKELDLWYLNERIYHEQHKLAKKKKLDQAAAEREARRKAWEAEQAQYPEPHPYQAEKDMCAGLTIYLQTLLGETVEKPAVNLRGSDSALPAPSLKSNGASREVSASGKAIGKSAGSNSGGFEDLAFSDFIKKPKSRGKKTRKSVSGAVGDAGASNDDSALKPHSIDYLTAFTRLEIKAPNRLSEVRTALEAVKAKAAFYETAPAPTPEEKAEKSKTKASDNKDNKSRTSQKPNQAVSNGVDLSNGDSGAAFPGLKSESGSAPTRSRDMSLPSFKAVASGVASAPVPIATPTLNESLNADMGMLSVNDESGTGAEEALDDAEVDDGERDGIIAVAPEAEPPSTEV